MLNAFFIPTSGSSVMYWRIQSFVEAAWRSGLASFQNPLWYKDLNKIQPWQEAITDGDKYDAMFIRQFVPMIESGCQQADAVVFQYAHMEGALELFDSIKIKYPHLPVLVEIDDNILSVPTYNEAHDVFDPRSEIRKRVLSQIRAADGVIASTNYLKEVFSEYNKNIYVVPNSIDFKAWDNLKTKSKKGIRIGWAGGNGHGGDFDTIQDAIIKILAKYPKATLVLANGPAKGGVPDWIKGHKQVEYHSASEWVPILKYPKFLANLDIDIGIAPLIDSAFNRGKSNLKWLENSALGIPTVAANVGPYAECIRPGQDGFLADNDAEFFAALDCLISNRKTRKSMGMAAKERIRQDYNINKTVVRYIDCLQKAIDLKGIPTTAEKDYVSNEVNLGVS